MFFINLSVVILYIMLAVFSRKHYSKYKDKKGLISGLLALHMAMGETILRLFKIDGIREGVKKSLRKLYVVSPKSLEELTQRYITKGIAISIFLLMVFNVVSGIIWVFERVRPSDSNIIIQRADYAGKEEEYEVLFTLNDKTYEYILLVAPREYTVEEFEEKGKEILDNLEKSMLGHNQSEENIHSDLVLYPDDILKGFELEWHSSNPRLIDSSGVVYLENVENNPEVVLTAYLTYLDYTLEREYHLTLASEDEDSSIIRETRIALESLELSSRNDEFIELPPSINGVEVGFKENKKDSGIKVFLLGVMIIIFAVISNKEKLRQAEKGRDDMLLKLYPAFVNKLWLLLGTGMTVKMALTHMVSEEREKNILTRELEYSLNQIKTGMDESFVYEELGRRLELAVYSRLMNQVSHNLKRGNSDLFEHMKEELDASMEVKKEIGKKRGEEASTKLLFPMIILMMVVMVIVIVPAMWGL